MKKVIYTLVVDDYPKEITDVTFPFMKHYAKKIGADFHVINERKYPDWPPVYEKLQIYDLGKEIDWNIFIDADALIKPDLFDVTCLINKDTVLFTGKDMSANRFRPDRFFQRDGRYIGACNWFTVASNWCIELWKPLEITQEEAVSNIFTGCSENNSGLVEKSHLIDDYTLSRNIAKYGLKHTTIHDLKDKFDRNFDDYFWHHYTIGIDEKVINLRQVAESWGYPSCEA